MDEMLYIIIINFKIHQKHFHNANLFQKSPSKKFPIWKSGQQ